MQTVACKQGAYVSSYNILVHSAGLSGHVSHGASHAPQRPTFRANTNLHCGTPPRSPSTTLPPSPLSGHRTVAAI